MKQPIVAGRIPHNWLTQLKQLEAETGKCQSELVREAVGQYLEKTDPESVAAMARRLAALEKQVKKLVQLI